MLDKAKRENTVVCLHSNASKNFLIINVIREHSTGIERSLNDGGQRIVCLTMGRFAETRSTLVLWLSLRVEQDPAALAELIHRHVPMEVGSFGMEHGVLLWKKEQWLQEMQLRSIFVMHPTVFHELLNRTYLG